MISRKQFNAIIMAMRDDAAAIVEAVNTMPSMNASLKEWANWQARGDTKLRKRLTNRIFGGNYNHVGRTPMVTRSAHNHIGRMTS